MSEEIYKTKSVENFNAGIFLSSQKPKFNNALIHNFYYSCYQYSLYIVLMAGTDTEEMKDKLRNSHEELINLVFKEINHSVGVLKAVDYMTKMGELKLLRNKADYRRTLIQNEQIYKAQRITKEIRDLLFAIFNV